MRTNSDMITEALALVNRTEEDALWAWVNSDRETAERLDRRVELARPLLAQMFRMAGVLM